jgi:hypothetical protein
MRRSGLLLKSPASAPRAFWTTFLAIGIPVGAALTVKTLFMGSFAKWLELLPVLLGIIFGSAALCGLIAMIPILIQGWAWRKIAEDTPVADHDEGLGS